LVLSSISPVFNNGGTLQQYDPINTPAYFQFTATSGQTSGTTLWNGSPAILPSFTLDTFNVTETDSGGSVIAGDLIMTWAQGYTAYGGVSPYDMLTLKITDFATGTITYGETTIVAAGNGLRTVTISMSGTITAATEFFLKVQTFDQTHILSGSAFYLPDY